MSDNSVIGNTDDENHPESLLPSTPEINPLNGSEEVNENATHSMSGGAAQGVHIDPAVFMHNLMGLLGQAPQVFPPPATSTAHTTPSNPIMHLKKMGAEKFYGTSGIEPSEAEAWLESTERVLKNLECSPEQKLKCFESLLQGEAHHWWEMERKSICEDEVTWKFFLDAFKREYVGELFMEGTQIQFLNLEQGESRVKDYYNEFMN